MKLNVSTINDKFVIEVDVPIVSIFIEKKGRTYFDKEEQAFTIDAKKLCSLMTPNIEDRLKIFYVKTSKSEPKEFIIQEEVTLNVSGALNIEIDNQVLSLYVTMDNHLRFISNQLPSAASYFKNSFLKNILVNDQSVQLEIECISKILPIKEVKLIIKNRKSKKDICFLPFNRNVVIKNKLFYHNAYFNISVTELISLLDHVNREGFDATVLDTFIEPIFDFSKTTIRQFKIQYLLNLEEEHWLTVDNYRILLKSYGTLNTNNLAFRTSFLSTESYLYYQDMKKESFKKIESTKRKVILISEYPHKAQDNGLQLFHYLNSEHSDVLDCYYIITENSKDLKNLQPFKDKVVIYKSKRHFELITRTDMILHTHSSNYALPLITSFMERYYTNIKKIFLQHGIIGERNLDYLYGKEQNPNFTDKFIVSSNREKKIVERELNYKSEDILLTGLARFDQLLDGNTKELSYSLRKEILIMPSWRQGLDHLNDREFTDTEFFKKFDELLHSNSLESLADQNSLNISFYLHTNFQKFNHLFSSKFISILNEGEYSVQDLLKSHGILITDFSSVGLDFSLLNRAVIYYQFDDSLLESRQAHKKFLPGPIVKTQKKLLEVLQKKVKNNSLPWLYKIRSKKNLYLYQDINARQRIFDQIMLFFK